MPLIAYTDFIRDRLFILVSLIAYRVSYWSIFILTIDIVIYIDGVCTAPTIHIGVIFEVVRTLPFGYIVQVIPPSSRFRLMSTGCSCYPTPSPISYIRCSRIPPSARVRLLSTAGGPTRAFPGRLWMYVCNTLCKYFCVYVVLGVVWNMRGVPSRFWFVSLLFYAYRSHFWPQTRDAPPPSTADFAV